MVIGDIVVSGNIIGVVCHCDEKTVTCACHDMKYHTFSRDDCRVYCSYDTMLDQIERSVLHACREHSDSK